MFFYDNKSLNPDLAPNWFTSVKVIEITPNPGVSGAGPFHDVIIFVMKALAGPNLTSS